MERIKKTIFISLIIISNSFTIFALPEYPVNKDSTEQTKSEIKRNLLFLEIAGNGGIISYNYERYINKTLSLRVGLGSDVFGGQFIPLMINYNFYNPFEIGLGVVPFNFGSSVRSSNNIFANQSSGILITSLLGYKKTFGWFLFKASFTPHFNPKNSEFLLFGGISFGISF